MESSERGEPFIIGVVTRWLWSLFSDSGFYKGHIKLTKKFHNFQVLYVHTVAEFVLQQGNSKLGVAWVTTCQSQ